MGGGNGMKWNGIEMNEINNFRIFFTFLHLRVHKGREWNGIEWNNHKGMERKGMKWNVFK